MYFVNFARHWIMYASAYYAIAGSWLGHYLNQCCRMINQAIAKKIQLNMDQNVILTNNLCVALFLLVASSTCIRHILIFV